jgi:hypothetical protein
MYMRMMTAEILIQGHSSTKANPGMIAYGRVIANAGRQRRAAQDRPIIRL